VADPSFDVVSKVDRQEVDNALNQASKELSTRFDFRGVGASIAWSGDHAIDIRANSEERAKAVLDVFKEKLVKRGVSLKAVDPGDPNHGIDLQQLASKYVRSYANYKSDKKSAGSLDIQKIPGVNHPVFKDKPINHDPREVFL